MSELQFRLMHEVKRKIVFLFPLLICFFIGLSSCSSHRERHILVIHSYDGHEAYYPDFNHLISAQFRKGGINADIRTLYLDCESYTEKPELERMIYLLDSVSKDWKPEVILVNEDQATYSLLKCGAPIVKEVPVVFAGVNYPNWALLEQFPNVTGFRDKLCFKENINMIQAILGKRTQLFTILDSTYLDMQVRRDVKQQLAGYKITGITDNEDVSTQERNRLVKEEGYIRFHAIPMRRYAGAIEPGSSLMWALNKNYRGQCYVQLKRDYTTVNIGTICVSPSMTMINEAFGYGEKLLGGYITSLPVQVEEEVQAAFIY